MRNYSLKYKSAIQLGFIAAIAIASSLGCEKYPIIQSVSSSTAATLPPVDSTDLVREMLAKVNFDRALNDLRKLTGAEPICIDNECHTIKFRPTGSEELRWAKNYVYQELAGLGYETELWDWSRSEYTDQNIIARKPGVLHPEEEVYFVAHLDGVVGSPAADDNASGAVDILELARVLHDYSFNRTVVLFISTGEEAGTLGVDSYLSQLSPSELSAIQNVVNIDMIGYDANQDDVMEFWYGDDTSSLDLANWMGGIIQAYKLNLEPRFASGCG